MIHDPQPQRKHSYRLTPVITRLHRYTHLIILSSWQVEKLALFSVNGVTLWQPAQIFFSVSIEHHSGRNFLFLKNPARWSYSNAEYLMIASAFWWTYKLVKKSEEKIKSSIIHHLEPRQSHTCNISASHSLKISLFDHVWPRHFFPGKNQHPCWFPLELWLNLEISLLAICIGLLLCFSSSGAHRSIFF